MSGKHVTDKPVQLKRMAIYKDLNSKGLKG